MSIDECFADFTNVYYQYGKNDIEEFLKNFQIGLFEKTKLKCSIGVAPTKFLAKMGSDMKKPNGITIIRKKDIPNKIFPLPIKAFFGIGKKTYPVLEEIGIKTIGDLYYAIKEKRPDVMDIIGSFAPAIISQLEGNSPYKINTEPNDPKSIGTTSTFHEDSDNPEFILPFMMEQTKSILKELHKAKKLTKTIQLTYKNAKFDEESCQFKVKQYSKTLMNPTNDDNALLDAVKNLFKETYNGQLIRMSGVCFQNLTDAKDAKIQMTFDDLENDESIDKTHDIIESLNREANRKMFFRASKLKDEEEFKNGSK
jgi:DNA polymerase IV